MRYCAWFRVVQALASPPAFLMPLAQCLVRRLAAVVGFSLFLVSLREQHTFALHRIVIYMLCVSHGCCSLDVILPKI